MSFGVAAATAPCRNAKASPKIVRSSADPLADVHRRRRELDVPLLVVEGDLQRLVRHLAHPAELVDEVHVPRGPAELAVGGRLQSHLFLQLHHLADRLVLDAAQLRVVDLSRGVALARLQQLARAQQAADVIRAKRGCGAGGHGAEDTVAPAPRARRPASYSAAPSRLTRAPRRERVGRPRTLRLPPGRRHRRRCERAPRRSPAR